MSPLYLNLFRKDVSIINIRKHCLPNSTFVRVTPIIFLGVFFTLSLVVPLLLFLYTRNSFSAVVVTLATILMGQMVLVFLCSLPDAYCALKTSCNKNLESKNVPLEEVFTTSLQQLSDYESVGGVLTSDINAIKDALTLYYDNVVALGISGSLTTHQLFEVYLPSMFDLLEKYKILSNLEGSENVLDAKNEIHDCFLCFIGFVNKLNKHILASGFMDNAVCLSTAVSEKLILDGYSGCK